MVSCSFDDYDPAISSCHSPSSEAWLFIGVVESTRQRVLAETYVYKDIHEEISQTIGHCMYVDGSFEQSLTAKSNASFICSRTALRHLR